MKWDTFRWLYTMSLFVSNKKKKLSSKSVHFNKIFEKKEVTVNRICRSKFIYNTITLNERTHIVKKRKKKQCLRMFDDWPFNHYMRSHCPHHRILLVTNTFCHRYREYSVTMPLLVYVRLIFFLAKWYIHTQWCAREGKTITKTLLSKSLNINNK